MKKAYILTTALFFVIASFYFSACKDDKGKEVPDAPYVTTPYTLNIPASLLNPNNPLTVEGVALGKMLYYDTLLDGVSGRSCAQCHIQKEGFSSYKSNALAHINLAWNTAFLWNGQIEGTMEDIMLFEVKDFFEADMSKLNANATYRDLFKKTFNADEITYENTSFAIAQFVRTLISADSRYDKYIQRKISLTPSEINGMNLYYSEEGDCFHCHGTPLLTDGDFHNNGLDENPEEGRMAVTTNPQDRGRFKSPTLRNIALTAPYMHDGRFETLEEVIDFYSEGLKYSPTIDPLMKQIHAGGMQLSPQEKADLLAFLHTFTDSTFINNPAFASPF
jgi:cytochrome c peroxidase